MKNIVVIALILSSCFLISCKKNTGTDPQSETLTATKTLVTNPWKVNKITDLSGNTINPSALPTEAKALFSINIQFLEDKTVRALDPVSKSVVNGGKWDLLDSDKILDIDVAQLKGKYPIVEMTRTKMILRNSIVFEGVTFNVNLELVPAI
jgi:hypothetical protein